MDRTEHKRLAALLTNKRRDVITRMSMLTKNWVTIWVWRAGGVSPLMERTIRGLTPPARQGLPGLEPALLIVLSFAQLVNRCLSSVRAEATDLAPPLCLA